MVLLQKSCGILSAPLEVVATRFVLYWIHKSHVCVPTSTLLSLM